MWPESLLDAGNTPCKFAITVFLVFENSVELDIIGMVEYLCVVAVTLVHWPGRTVSCEMYTVEPLYNGYHWEPTFCLLQRDVPNSGASGIFPVGMVLCNPAVEYNMAAFSELSFPVRWERGLSRG